MNSPPLHTSHEAYEMSEGDDVVGFVVQDGAHTLYFSKRALTQHTAFFREFFATHSAAASGNTVVLRHVTAVAAEAALRLCHSPHHADNAVFKEVLRRHRRAHLCNDGTAATTSMSSLSKQQRVDLHHLLSLYETCVKFGLHRHAHAVAEAAASSVSEACVLDVLKTCARYAATLPREERVRIGLDTLLAACRSCVPTAWACEREERRWRRLCVQYPELPALLLVAATAATKKRAPEQRSAAPPLLLSPLRDDHESNGTIRCASSAQQEATKHHVQDAGNREEKKAGTMCVRSHGVPPAAPLETVFTHHLQQTEELALAAQRRRHSMESEVAALRSAEADLRARVRADEEAAAASTRYLGDARVYVQALRAAEADMRALCTALAPLHAETTAAAAPHAAQSASSKLHVLRHELQSAAETAAHSGCSIDEMLRVEEDALRRLDEELVHLRSEVC